jgi:hypothetical protein
MHATSPTDATTRALQIVTEHLRHAQRSHELAQHMHAQGQIQAARQQSRMTRIYLHNALHRIDLHSQI